MKTDGRRYFAHPAALVESQEIGDHTRIWAFAHVLKGARVGPDCNICDHAFIEGGAWLGRNVTVKNGVSIWTGITIEDHCFLGPHCVFTNDMNPRAFIKKGPGALLPTRVRTGATIGANATIVCGTVIGQYAFVGAGAVVIRDVADYALVVGNPARQAGWMCACATRLPLPAEAPIEATCTCAACGVSYVRSLSGLSTK